MTIEVEVLSYRELADRLGVSADAARNRAKRRARIGLWRIIPGNHPSERVRVEIPASDLAPAAARTPARRSRAVPAGITASADWKAALDRADARIERLTAVLLDCQTVLHQAQHQLDRKNVAIARAWQHLERVRAEAAERIIEAQARRLDAERALRLCLAELEAERARNRREVGAGPPAAQPERRGPWWSRWRR